MATFFPGGMFNVSSLTSPMLVLRDERLKVAKQNATRVQRDLSRDRMTLERKEKSLLAECKRLASKGNVRGATIVASEVAALRRIHDRNLQSSVQIDTKTQSMVSNHKVNRAEVETIKGYAYANTFESFNRMEQREQKYAWRMNAINHMENSTRKTLDELYRDNGDDSDEEDAFSPKSYSDFSASQAHDMELQSIIDQAMQGQAKMSRPSQAQTTGSAVSFVLFFELYNQPEVGASIELMNQEKAYQQKLPTNMTVDDLKRKIVEDEYVASQLGLYDNGHLLPFQLGRREANRFRPLPLSSTLRQLRVQPGMAICIRVLENSRQSSTAS